MIITTEYLDIKDVSVNTGLWYSKNSVNSGNNLNWNITADTFNNKNTRQKRLLDMIAVSRNSVASYFDYDGILKFAPINTPRMEFNPITKQRMGLKVERESTNLILRSEEFDDVMWTSQAQGITVASNSILAPDGTLTADKLNETATTDYHRRGQNINGSVGSVRRFSIYAKAGERTVARGWSWAGGDTSQQTFNLLTGTVVGTLNPTMTYIFDGWWRCEFDVPSAHGQVIFGPSDGVVTGTNMYAGVANSGIYVWGAQLEVGASATSYIRTTTAQVTRSADIIEMPTTLVDAYSTTNIALYSEDLTNVVWIKSETTITSNSALAPNATTTADLVIPSTNNAIHSHKQTINVINNNRYIYSTHVKKNTGSSLVKLSIGFSSVLSGYFNLDTATWSNVTPKATVAHEVLADGWYRISISGIATADGNVDFTASQYQAVETTFAGDGTSGNLFWGAQVEVSSYMNTYMGSYVVTTATVASDLFNVGWFNQNEGTIACEFVINDTLSTGEDYTVFSIDDGTTTQQNTYHVKVTPQNIATVNVISGNTTVVNESSGTYTKGSSIRVGFGYKLNDVAVAYNGNAVTTDTTATLPITSQSRIRFGSRGNVGENILKNGYINKFIYYPFKLDNPSIQELSKL